MPNTFIPTQLGFTPTGSFTGSNLVFGRDIDSDWEAIGFGAQGRPDFVSTVQINLTESPGGSGVLGTLVKWGNVNFNVQDLIDVMDQNPNAPTTFNFALQQMLVCESGVTKNIMVLASQSYPTGSN